MFYRHDLAYELCEELQLTLRPELVKPKIFGYTDLVEPLIAGPSILDLEIPWSFSHS